MMGLSHVLLGTGLGLVTIGAVSGEPAAEQAGWVAVWGGMSLYPDLDHPSSTISQHWGPVTSGLRVRWWGKSRQLFPGISGVVAFLTGGHRRGTHNPISMALTLLVVWLASWTRAGTALVLAVATGAAITMAMVLVRSNVRRNWPLNLLASIGAGVASFTFGWVLPWWVPIAMAGGIGAHILGDMLTLGGIPWSVGKGRYVRISILPMETGGVGERVIMRPLVLVPLNLIPLAYLAGFHPLGAAWSALLSLT